MLINSLDFGDEDFGFSCFCGAILEGFLKRMLFSNSFGGRETGFLIFGFVSGIWKGFSSASFSFIGFPASFDDIIVFSGRGLSGFVRFEGSFSRF